MWRSLQNFQAFQCTRTAKAWEKEQYLDMMVSEHGGQVWWMGTTGSGQEQQAGTVGGEWVILLNYVFI